LGLDLAAVRWDELIEGAVFRKPPFSSGPHERGFRDALILQSLVQASEARASTKTYFVVYDADLAMAAQGVDGVSVVRDLNDLRSNIEALRDDALVEIEDEESRFKGYLLESATALQTGGQVAEALAQSMLSFATGLEDITLSVDQRRKRGTTEQAVRKTAADELDSLYRRLAGEVSELTTGVDHELNTAIERIAAAATSPLAFTDSERGELEGALEAFRGLLDAIGYARHRLEELVSGAGGVEDLLCEAGYSTPSVFMGNLERLMAKMSALHGRGIEAADAFDGLLRGGDETGTSTAS